MKTNTITAAATLRLTEERDIPLLPAIERSAAQAFRQIPALAWLAESEVISPERHRLFLETDHSLLAVADDQPIGFLLSEPLDDALFIVEIAVHQAWQGRGIGRTCLRFIMRCPFCHSPDTQVIDSRSSEEGWTIRRRRKCPKCGKRFSHKPC